MKRRPGFSIALLLAACAAEPPAAEPANEIAQTPRSEMPPALRGRWGASLADCAAGRSATDSILDIAATELRFHESRARLGTVVEHGPRRIVADFVYEGEGETRTHREGFELLDNGLLVRRDAGGAPRAEVFAYSRCEG
ncbi:MAG TPA: hypothetical protein VF552_11465 [Allosphingosinicella sp.]|jgi:hypothetical protein